MGKNMRDWSRLNKQPKKTSQNCHKVVNKMASLKNTKTYLIRVENFVGEYSDFKVLAKDTFLAMAKAAKEAEKYVGKVKKLEITDIWEGNPFNL